MNPEKESGLYETPYEDIDTFLRKKVKELNAGSTVIEEVSKDMTVGQWLTDSMSDIKLGMEEYKELVEALGISPLEFFFNGDTDLFNAVMEFIDAWEKKRGVS